MKTHIPDHATGRTLCGRPIRYLPDNDQGIPVLVPPCISLTHDCVEDATCAACQRVDDAQQAAQFREARLAAMFIAACRWAASVGATHLAYDSHRRVALAVVVFDGVSGHFIRKEADLRFDAADY